MKLLIVEDDRKLQSFVARALTEDGYVVDVCRSGREALEQTAKISYDLIVLDWMLPEGDGLSVCRSLRTAGSRVPVLMLTARDEVGEGPGPRRRGRRLRDQAVPLSGALAQVRSLLRRAGDSQIGVLRVGKLSLDLRHRSLSLPGRRIELTGRELGLLELLMRHNGRVVTRTGSWSRSGACTLIPRATSSRAHMRRLREKLGDAAGAPETVRGQGYRLAISEASP